MMGLDRALGPLRRRVMLMVSRAIVELVDDAAKLQRLQVSLLADELRGDVERVQQYGFTSVPQPGAEAVALSVGGNRDHVVVIAVDDRRYRLTGLANGEVALYTDQGDRIHIKRGGTLEVTAATKVHITSPLTQLTGDLQVAGNITAGGDVADQSGTKTMRGMRAAYNTHVHGSSPTPNVSM